GGSASSTTPPTPIATPTPLAAPRLTAATKGKQPAKATSPTESSNVERTEAKQLKIVLRRSRHVTHISQQGGSSTDEGTEEESFDPILRTPEESEDDGNDEEDQGLRFSEEEMMQEEEDADELYRDVDINQGRGLQVSQDIDDSHVTLTLIHSDGQESSSTSSFMTSLLNLIIDPGMESIFTTGSSFVTPIPSPKSTMTPSIITTTTTASQPPIPPTSNPSDVLQTLPTFASVFRFKDRVKSLEVNFSKLMRTNQSTEAVSNILDEQRKLYKALVEAYDADKTILDSYGESAILKRRREDDDDQEGPSAGSDRGSKRRRKGGEHASASTPSEPATTSTGMSTTGTQSRQLSASESAFTEEPVQTTCQMDEPSLLPRKPPTPVRDWNKTLPTAQGNAQSWISALAKQTDARSSFNELLDTLIDFSNFIMNRLGVDTLTLELLVGPTYELMRESCNSLTELEYYLEEVYKATTDQLDWDNLEGQHYPHNLLQPLSLILDNRGRRVISFAHFINNDLDLQGGTSSRKYTTSMTKTKAADYGHIKWIEDLVPHTMWIQEPLNYDKHALWGVSHWGRKRQQFYGLMRIDELHKFCDGTLNDVRNALDDRLKGIRMQYFPTTIWIKGDKHRAAAMIQAIDKMIKTRRIMRSLERFVGGRQYEGDF
nr:hypothetical protein [Tanacetum cinerariifolium]